MASLRAQDTISNRQARQRKLIAGTLSAAGYAGSLVMLNETWYKNYPKSSFHTFNDAKEWLQVDKVGHAWTAYNTSRAATALWKWAGFRNESYDKAVMIGSLSGFTYLTVIEVLDAHSANWGWSWPDMGANFVGTALFAGQEWLWRDQRIQFKFSAHRKQYPADLRARANNLYGGSLPERLLKDYNGQTYWLSANLRSFFPQSKIPSWISISLGYGAEGMFGGFENKAFDDNGNLIFDRPDIQRYRQWYLAPDIDLTKLKTNSRFVRTMLTVLNSIKVPAPALELSKGKLKLKALVF